MKKHCLAALVAAALLALPQLAAAEGFGLVEWSAEGVAMGGARMFAENDPANIAYNPAAITKVPGEAIKFSATYISPHGKYDAFDVMGAPGGVEKGHNRIHPAWVPGVYWTKQLNEKDWVGIGTFARFGMLSQYERGSLAPSTNNAFAKLNSISITPTYAHKFDKKWSAAVGAEINYASLELQRNIFVSGLYPLMGNAGFTQTEGESYALGWNAAASYAFDDKNEMGVVYRSRIHHSMNADTDAYSGLLPGRHMQVDAYGKVTLPDSWAIGYNHKFNDRTRVELNATRTMWSTYDKLNISFNPPLLGQPGAFSDKNWESGWRYAIGLEHKISDKYSVMAGFSYDTDAIPYDGGDFIVPTGNRRTYSIGGRYNDKDQALAFAIGFMDIGDLSFAGHADQLTNYSHVHTHDNYAKIFSLSYERHF